MRRATSLEISPSADVNGTNTGTLWTAAHCAAFQGHGKALMIIMNHSPNLTLKDHEGRCRLLINVRGK